MEFGSSMKTTARKYDDTREDHQGANKTNKQQMDRASLQIPPPPKSTKHLFRRFMHWKDTSPVSHRSDAHRMCKISKHTGGEPFSKNIGEIGIS